MKENTFLIIDGPQRSVDQTTMRKGEIRGETSHEMWILTSAALIKLKSKKTGHKAKLLVRLEKKKSVHLKLESGEAKLLVPAKNKKQARELSLRPRIETTLPVQPLHDTNWYETVLVIRKAIKPEAHPAPAPPQPPSLAITSPPNHSRLVNTSVVLSGQASPLGSMLKINGKSCSLNGSGKFSCLVPLDKGPNLIVLQLTTPAGSTAFQKWLVTRIEK